MPFIEYDQVASGGYQPEKKTSTGQKILNAAQKVSNFVGAKGITDLVGASTAQNYIGLNAEQKKQVEFPTSNQVFGSIAQSGANLIPGGGGLVGNAAKGALAGYGYDVGSKLQNNKSVTESLKPGVGTAVGAGLPFATALLGSLTKKVSGFLSGSGTDVINRAIKYPDAVQEAVQKYARTPETKQELVKTAQDAISTYLQNRGKTYGESINLLKTAGPLTKESAVNSFVKKVSEFGGKIEPKGLSFTNSSLTKNDQNNLKQAFSTIKNWSDFSVSGLDTLRQAIGNHMDDFSVLGNTRANVILGEVKKNLTSYLNSNAKGYQDVLSKYGQQTELARVLSKELSLGGQAKPSTQLNQVLRLFRKDPQVIRNLESTMGREGAGKFLNDISGAILSEWLPPGKLIPALEALGGAGLGAIGLASGVAGSTIAPAALVGAGMSSPRIVGKAARIFGQGAETGLNTGIKKGVSLLGSKFNN